jgi:hypothetical protein
MSEYHAGSREQLVDYLEQVSGRTIRTRADLEAYLNELRAGAAAPRPVARRWTIARNALLGAALLIALLQYYLIDVYVEIASLQHVQFFNPDEPGSHRSAAEFLRLFS